MLHIVRAQAQFLLATCFTQARDDVSGWPSAEARQVLTLNPSWFTPSVLELVRNKAAWGAIDTSTAQGKSGAKTFRPATLQLHSTQKVI